MASLPDVRTISLKFCDIDFNDWGCRTHFPDGAHVDATPHDTHDYAAITHRLGYVYDRMAYCQEHEFAHAFVAERLSGSESIVLRNLALGAPVPKGPGLMEELAAQAFQRWLRGNERPILSGADWDALKAEALEKLS